MTMSDCHEGRRASDAAALVARIESAFPPRALGDGMSITQALLLDELWEVPAEPWARAYAADATHDWRAIDERDLARYFESFSVFGYLDDGGWRYYLPAAMRVALRPFGADCAFYTLLALTRAHLTEDRLVSPREQFARLELTEAQGRCIGRFLRHLQRHDADISWSEWPEIIAAIERWESDYG